MQLAVAQFFIVKTYFLEAFFGDFLDIGQLFPLFFICQNLLQKRISRFAVNVQIVVQISSYYIADIVPDGLSVGLHVLRTQFGFCLRFENRLVHTYGNGCHNGSANIAGFEILFEKFTDGIHRRFPECCHMRAALRGVLPVYKRIDFLSVIFMTVGKRKFKITFFNMNDRINNLPVNVALEQIEQSILRFVFVAVEIDAKAFVQVCIIPEQPVNMLLQIFIFAENVFIRCPRNAGSTLIGAGCIFGLFYQISFAEIGNDLFAIAHGFNPESRSKSIYRLGSHTVESD
ncbi:hypothetical protein SDC9_90419 [bioreactor metagenome]|uniref:Uncharacterized protein n=1 Tax=bioreactor metagenome TaxID=1076179 RepID=A0A644ZSB2_9ZZZZ